MHFYLNVIYYHRWSEIFFQILQTLLALDCSLIKGAIWTVIVLQSFDFTIPLAVALGS